MAERKRSTDKAAQRKAAAQAKVTNAEETASEPTKPAVSRKQRTTNKRYQEATASGVPIPPANKVKDTIFKPQTIPPRRGKTAAKVDAARLGGIAAKSQEAEQSRNEIVSDADQARQASEFRNLVTAELEKRTQHLTRLKKLFPTSQAVQDLEHPTYESVARELASQPKPTTLPTPLTPTQQKNFEDYQILKSGPTGIRPSARPEPAPSGTRTIIDNIRAVQEKAKRLKLAPTDKLKPIPGGFNPTRDDHVGMLYKNHDFSKNTGTTWVETHPAEKTHIMALFQGSGAVEQGQLRQGHMVRLADHLLDLHYSLHPSDRNPSYTKNPFIPVITAADKAQNG